MTRMCSCGCTFVDTASGRHNHRVLFGHAPVWSIFEGARA
jgi:hypothetical protein